MDEFQWDCSQSQIDQPAGLQSPLLLFYLLLCLSVIIQIGNDHFGSYFTVKLKGNVTRLLICELCRTFR